MSVQKIRQILKNTEYANGSNKSSAKDIYEKRMMFNQKHKYKPNSIDLQTMRSFYGRIDLNQNVIYPDAEKMVNLYSNGKQKDVLVLPFVNDAYQELTTKINDFIRLGKLSPNEILPLTAQQTYVNFENSYQNNLKEILDLFFKISIQNGKINSIKNFKDFINEFIIFTSISNVSLTMTKYGIARSNMTSTGLMIETKKQKMDLDIIKDLFYTNSNYETYNKLLLTYGFSVDKLAPWRMIFNIDSKIAQTYMAKYNLTNINDMFNNFYKKTYETDMSVLMTILLTYYNDKICAIKPNVFETKTKQTNNGFKSYYSVIERKKIDEQNLYELIPELSLLKLYFYIRLKEESFDLSQEEFDSLMTKVTILYQDSGVNAVNDFVNQHTRFITNDGANASLSLTRESVTSYNRLNVYFRI